ncbi:MAG: twin-arginine translocase subunit TatB [Deltaproteobacteria bacterium]|nr:MAG: twin-arginine translocase subunit TatB [Deltaproteobacteria bacterium]
MFGIGLPEMILIMAIALIVVGPDKLPDLARSLAKGILELKKTAEGLKETIAEESDLLEEVRPDLELAAKNLRKNLVEPSPFLDDEIVGHQGVNPSPTPAPDAVASAYEEVIRASRVQDHNDKDVLEATTEAEKRQEKSDNTARSAEDVTKL